MMGNAFDNLQYSMAAGIANNPALYAMYQISGLLDSVAHGIALPDIKYLGSGVNLQTTVADLMRVVALSGGILSGIGQIASAGGNGGITGGGILDALKLKQGISTVSRGTGVGLSTAGGISYSESGSMIGNSASDDIQNKTVGDASENGKAQLAEAAESSEETKLSEVYTEVVNIYRLLQEIADGRYTLSVDVVGDDFGSL
jgi:hypothetical protein